MRIKLPPEPVPVEHQALSFEQVSQRWKTRLSIARLKLKKAGVPIVFVSRQPVEGVRMTDLLKYEEEMREKYGHEEVAK